MMKVFYMDKPKPFEDGKVVIHRSDYKTELVEANMLLEIDSDMDMIEVETPTKRWFELNRKCFNRTGFIKIPYAQTVFVSSIGIIGESHAPV